MAIEIQREGLILSKQHDHPRVSYLRELLEKPLPDGAHELVREAIAEYRSAFDFSRPPLRDDGNTHPTTISVDIDEDGPHTLLAGKNKLLTVRYGQKLHEDEPLGEPYVHVITIVKLRNVTNVRIYPDWLRYTPLDQQGRSRPVRFMLGLPEQNRGINGMLKVKVLNGSVAIARIPWDFRLA